MVCYPEVQKKAQAELDNVLNGRLPEHSDIASLPYLSALVKEVYRYAAVSFEYSLLLVNCVFRWQPIVPLGRPLFVSNIVTSWHPCLVKASRINRLAMISTTAIISPPTLLWWLTNGDGHLPPLNMNFLRFSKSTLQGDVEQQTGLSRTARIQARALSEEWKTRQFS